ncbi:MAG: SsrA-binding protein [Flavobacteriales bacterium CG_4_10_14_0_2_um_filter_32_8]|nr:MAG: SsrA-binding protein [Flavobacteriales bacterium CG_4_10_14_0_2_um_filter_32_8]PJB15711.1 MAG: SsrA-binding protein [Flavobacteriales bacterium CG_4_9_14_3_um_filter_32_8]
MSTPINIKNRRAKFEYEFLEKFTAGIQLTGTEIKSIRAGKASIVEAFCFINNDELFIKNMFIAEYEEGSYNNHEPRRVRKLLLNRNEIDKLVKKKKDVGLTIIPINLFINGKGYAKIDIALAKGKKLYDKRQDLKSKDDKRSMDRAKKS